MTTKTALAALLAIVAWSAVVATSSAAAPGDITLAGTQPIPNSSFVTDVWGYYDPLTQKEYAIIGDNNRAEIHILDVTYPGSIDAVAVVQGIAAFDMKVYQHYLYACDGNTTGTDTRIVDISDPAHPEVLPFTLNSTHNLATSPSGLLFMEKPGLRIFDLSNPEHPVWLWASTGSDGHDATAFGTRLLDFHGYLGTRIWNVGIPTGPKLLGTIDSPDVSFHHSGDVTDDGNYLFICNELATHPMPDFTVWDIRNPAAPAMVASWSDPDASVHNLYIEGGFAFVSYYAAGFRVFDVSDPGQPVLLDEYDTSATTGEGFSGAFGVYPFAPSGRVYVSDWDNGLFVFEVEPDVTTPVAFTAVDARPAPGGVVVTWDVLADEPFSGFGIHRASGDGSFVTIDRVGVAARSYLDTGARAGGHYRYVVSAQHGDGSEVFAPEREVVVPAKVAALLQNHPNPFNPSTTITFVLPSDQNIRLEVFDAGGRLVETLVQGVRPAGESSVRWDGRDRAGRPLASGLYFYRLVTGDGVFSRRMLLLK